MARPPRIPVLLPPEQSVAYFVTLCVAKRRPVLSSAAIFEAARNFCTTHPHWFTHALVIMPDHLHALASPFDREAKVTQYSAGLKRTIKKTAGGEWRWQEGAFDRLLREDESLMQKWFYLRENPVRAGLVGTWQQWPYFLGMENEKQPANL